MKKNLLFYLTIVALSINTVNAGDTELLIWIDGENETGANAAPNSTITTEVTNFYAKIAEEDKTYPTFETGKIGNAFTHDGMGGCIQSDTIGFDTASFSYCAWFRLNSMASSDDGKQNKPVFGKALFTLNGAGSCEVEPDGFIRAWFVGDQARSRANSYDTASKGDWTHVAFVLNKEDSTLTFYLDGAKDTTITGASVGDNGQARVLNIGAHTLGRAHFAQSWDGQMDDIAFFSGLLTDADITKIYNDGIADFLQNKDNSIEINQAEKTFTIVQNSENIIVNLTGLYSADIQIYNILGKVVYSNSNVSNNIVIPANFNTGLYIIRVNKEARKFYIH